MTTFSEREIEVEEDKEERGRGVLRDGNRGSSPVILTVVIQLSMCIRVMRKLNGI